MESSGFLDGDQTILRLRRAVDTGDSDDYPIDEGNTPIAWALGGTGGGSGLAAFTKHTAANRGFAVVDFFSGQVEPQDGPRGLSLFGVNLSPFQTHGLGMGLAWVACAPVAVSLARHSKALGHSWYLWHRGLQTAVVLLTTVSIGYAFLGAGASVFIRDWPLHGILGMGILVCSLGLAASGVLANRWWDPKRLAPPLFPDVAHGVCGKLTVLAAMTNIYLGVILEGSTPLLWALVPVACVFVLFAVREVRWHLVRAPQ